LSISELPDGVGWEEEGAYLWFENQEG